MLGRRGPQSRSEHRQHDRMIVQEPGWRKRRHLFRLNGLCDRRLHDRFKLMPRRRSRDQRSTDQSRRLKGLIRLTADDGAEKLPDSLARHLGLTTEEEEEGREMIGDDEVPELSILFREAR